MQWSLIRLSIVVSLTILSGLPTTTPMLAQSAYQPLAAVTPFDLINAVNQLRISYGLPPYSVNSILMETAQAQAEFMASTGDVTHSGPEGIGLTQRLLAAGYPLAGDISAGGFRAENISSGNEDRTAQSVVEGWSGDALHLNTMISPNLSEIGAGVAVANGRVYFVIDCALPTSSALPAAVTSIPGTDASTDVSEVPTSAIVLSTPNSNGDVIHEVKPGESLWQLAIAYDVRIDEIKRDNNLLDDNIYPGNTLVIKRAVILTTPSQVATASSPVPQTLVPSTPILFSETEVASWSSEGSRQEENDSGLYIAIGIITLALLGGGVVTWWGNRTKKDI
ncbi:MAG TPA: CAP domain-containing protein [Anaerolineales bacterium]|nr:CAP domain-containing protein [Anaerolineales bacterium]